MYDHLLGDVITTRPARVVLRVGGVGYDLMVPTSTSSALTVGEQACLYTILHVTDSQHSMLGFRRQAERDLARRLMTTSGVGPSMTLAILSSFTPEQVVHALVEGDHTMLKRVKGLGAKTAERLCIELRDTVSKLDLGIETSAPRTLLPQSSEDAVAALMTLGYSEKDARKKVEQRHAKTPDASTEELIKAVLSG